MRKGLVITLGVVALLFAVKPGFSFAPVISCIPDIIVSDAEQNLTVDNNFFVFSSALNLDDLARDDDTSKAQLRWSFYESAPGNTIQIAGKDSLTAPQVADPAVLKDPAALNLRTGGAVAAVRNKAWSPVTGTLPYPNPPASSQTATIQLIVSDGVAITSQPIFVKTVNTGIGAATNPAAQKDAIVPQSTKSYTFDSGAQGWNTFTSAFPAPTLTASSGRLRMTETAAQVPIVYGAWESPKDPTLALKQRWGCILRARYKMFSSVNGQACPGFRMRAVWSRVMLSGSTWIPDFLSADTNDNYEMQVMTTDLGILFVPGREPGTAGQTYTLLYYPQQTDTLMTTSGITYISCDLLDSDTFGDDAGELSIDQVDVDGIARPAVGSGTAVPELSANGNFSSWGTYKNLLDASGIMTGVTITSTTVNGIAITAPTGTKLWNAGANSPTVALTSGRYYRAVFTCTSTATPGGNVLPTVRTGFVSSRLVWVMNKRLEGGGSFSMISTTPKEYEMWACAPSPYPAASTQTEPMSVRFEAFSLSDKTMTGVNVSGTVRTSKVVTESFPAP